jgi:hypothetical protein
MALSRDRSPRTNQAHTETESHAPRRESASADVYPPLRRGHFGSLVPYGLRDPDHPEQEPECNYNARFVVLASPGAAADRYFRALRSELQDALDEGVILIERQVVWIP